VRQPFPFVIADAVTKAAAIVEADQHADGGWLLDSSDSIGSPATYGAALATALARLVLARASPGDYKAPRLSSL
jgi:hypothetical protein